MRKLLFIHPDQKLAGIYQRHLAPYFSVDSIQDGLAGLRMIRAHRPQAIISDYQLPYMSGLALLKFVRSHPEMFATPFLFLTNSPMPDEALGMGATAWLKQSDHSPFEMLNLFQHLRI